MIPEIWNTNLVKMGFEQEQMFYRTVSLLTKSLNWTLTNIFIVITKRYLLDKYNASVLWITFLLGQWMQYELKYCDRIYNCLSFSFPHGKWHCYSVRNIFSCYSYTSCLQYAMDVYLSIISLTPAYLQMSRIETDKP